MVKPLEVRASRPTVPRRVMDMHAPGVVPSGLRPTPAVSAGKKARQWPIRSITIGLACLAVICGVTLLIWLLAGRAHPTTLRSTGQVQQTADAYQVVDDPKGVKFSINKDFTAISLEALQKLSPHFIYGFQIADVNHVQCIISQTPRAKAINTTPDELAKGTFSQLKSNFPDTVAIGYQAITLENSQPAAELIVSYHDQGVEVKQSEVVAATAARTTFAFCTSPDSLYGFYQPKFDQFFTHLVVY